MRISAGVYFVAGMVFVIAPEWTLRAINAVSAALVPDLELAPILVEKFWLALAFSMSLHFVILPSIISEKTRDTLSRFLFPRPCLP
jgi:hypothetical protein